MYDLIIYAMKIFFSFRIACIAPEDCDATRSFCVAYDGIYSAYFKWEPVFLAFKGLR